MRLRQLVLACGLSAFVLSPYASALGLGEVTLKSALNQPLQAEIKLLDTQDLTADQILVTLASPADFERNGVDRLYFYSEFKFEVILEGADAPKVIVTSRSPVREPYLNFLVEARWTAGRLLREYTLLMDLPTFAEDSPSTSVAPVTGATSGYEATRERPRPEARPATRPAPQATSRAPSSTPAAAIEGDSYAVRANDNLWNIARQVSNSSGASIHQAMMALYEANPEAFINGNINLLRRGQVLRIPSSSEMTSRSRAEAVQQFAAQSSGDSNLGAQLSGSSRARAAESGSGEISGRVKLAAPSSGMGEGSGSGSNKGSGAGLEAELAATLEELDKSKAENTELSSRVRDLEAQIETMERLVDVSNEKLRAMQLTAQQTKTAQETAVADTTATAQESVSEPAQPAVVASSSQAASSAAAVAAAPKPQVKPITPPAPTATDTLISNAPWIGLGALLLGAGGYFFYRRRKEQAEAEVADEDVFAMDDSVVEEEFPVEPESYESPAEEEVELGFEDDSADADDDVSVVDKADIHIAYGQLDKAEALLLKGLDKDPGSSDIRLKLLEVYSNQRDLPAFDKHYAALVGVAGTAALARAAELRAAIPGAGELDLPLAESAAPAESHDDFAGLDFDDLDLSSGEVAGSSSAQAEPALDLAADDLDFDLNLDDDFSLDAAPAPAAAVQSDELDMADDWSLSESSAETGNELLDDFDLQLDDEPVAAAEAEDLSDLSLALDSLDDDHLPQDLSSEAPSIEEEFSFDFQPSEAVAEEAEDLALEAQELDVAADDFNLDMNVDDVDLAALDHEMEALDQDMDEVLEAESASVSPALAADDDFALDDIGDDLGDLETEFDADADLSTNGLVLTDHLDVPEASAAATLEADDDFQLQDLGALSGDFEDSDTQSEKPQVASESVDEFDLEAFTDAEPLVSQESEPAPVVQNAVESVSEDDVFAEALSDFSGEDSDLELEKLAQQDFDLSDEDMDAELDFLADADEAATKLDLARAYMDMGDVEGAKDILAEVVNEGNDEQRAEAQSLLGRIDA